MNVQNSNDEWRVSARLLNCDTLLISDGCDHSDGQVARRAGLVSRATLSEWGIVGFPSDKCLKMAKNT